MSSKPKDDKSSKQVKVRHVHHKPYRKRHYLTLVSFLALAAVVIGSVILYFNESYVAQRVASQTISDMFGRFNDTVKSESINSTYGFSLKYNTKQYYPSAVDGTTGDLYVGSELSTERSYETIRLSRQNIDTENGSVKLSYYPGDKPVNKDPIELEQKYIVAKQSNQTSLKKATTAQQTVDGVAFQRTKWTRAITTKNITLTTSFISYSGIVHGSPLTLIIYQGVGSMGADAIVKGLHFRERTQAVAPVTVSLAERKTASLRLLDSSLGFTTVRAADPRYTASERISATYGPAVVKIYNVMAGDLAIDGRTIIKDHLAGGTGSGFIVSSDGYVATNGHVAVINPRDEIVTVALEEAQNGNEAPFYSLVDMSTATQQEMDKYASDNDKAKYLIKKIYDISESRFSFVDAKQNLLVGLNEDQVDIQTLVKRTVSKQIFNGPLSVKSAKLIESNYDGIILPSVTGEFTNSDVALIKMEGSNYPMTSLGSMDDISQGSNLNIMGFPGIGSDNGIVSQTKTSSTLTTGKVSSLKRDTGNRQLIETDTEIGHGNSGGPAFSDEGKVIGIATYAIDPGGEGDGTLNYVRDISDFQSIADKSHVDFATSDTQQEWDKAIQFFYTARYKKALSHFEKVSSLYPEHPLAEKMIATTQKRIANGENIDDFPIVETSVMLVIVLLGVAGSIVMIVRHKKKHTALTQAVASGVVQPMAPGAPAQYVPILPNSPLSQPLVTPTTLPPQLPIQAPVSPQPSVYSDSDTPPQQRA